jgi:putative tryptophan/tyrosine transport system substrate-binding protein
MRRREFIALLCGAVAWSWSAHAQSGTRVYRLGFLRNGPPPPSFIQGFQRGLRGLGYIEGQNVTIHYALADGPEKLPDAAAELVHLKVDVIIASGTPPTVAAKNATRTIPIVYVASIDPIATGLVASLARPGGNITGFAGLYPDLMGKQIELLHEIIPGLSRVALLAYANNPGTTEYVRQAEAAALALGVQLHVETVRNPSDFEHAFDAMIGAGGAIQLDDVVFTSHRKQVVDLAVKRQLPMIHGHKEFVDAGGLLSYGSDLPDQYRRAAVYIDKILNGANPADLPVQQPTKLELIINLKAARTIGLEVPAGILARADEVIE